MTDSTDRLDDADFERLAEHIRGLLETLEQLPDPKIKDDVFELLNSLDLLHREALARVLALLEAHAPHLLPQLEQDFAIRTLLMLYSFMPEAAPTAARSTRVTFIPIDHISVSPALKMPVWIPGGNIADIPSGTLRSQPFEDVSVLLANIEGEIVAYQNACLDSILPLDRGQVDEYFLTCPWHQCKYDLRTGEIQNGSGLKLEKFPVKVADDGRFSVGFNIPKYS